MKKIIIVSLLFFVVGCFFSTVNALGYVNRPEPAISEGRVGVKLNGKWGCIDLSGREVIPLKYDYIENRNGSELYKTVFNEGVAVVSENGRYGCIDRMAV